MNDDDVVMEHSHEDAITEEAENESGEKEMVEAEPTKEKVKIVEASGIHQRYSSTLDKDIRVNAQKRIIIEFYRKVFHGL